MKPAFLCTWHEWHDLNNIFCFCEVAKFVTIKFNWSAGQVLLVEFLPNQSLKQNIFHFKILEPIVAGHHLSLQFHLYQIIIDSVQFTSIYIASVIIMTVCRCFTDTQRLTTNEADHQCSLTLKWQCQKSQKSLQQEKKPSNRTRLKCVDPLNKEEGEGR